MIEAHPADDSRNMNSDRISKEDEEEEESETDSNNVKNTLDEADEYDGFSDANNILILNDTVT